MRFAHGYEIDKLNLDTRLYHIFCRKGITTISKLKKLSDEDLKKIGGIGEKSIAEIREKLRKKTNYDKIKAMSFEEMRDFMISCSDNNRCFFLYECGGCVGECDYCVEHWLKSEVKED